ncbi:MAG: hypothetical protein C5B50_03270 [Verrucomicrobia bacterium]|nr:MAG: hypothetical protein C5B50_03270 [Verrucomicrobiota bacterium]
MKTIYILMLLSSILFPCRWAKAEVMHTVLAYSTTSSTPWPAIDFDGDGTNDIFFKPMVLCIVGWGWSSCSYSLNVASDDRTQVLCDTNKQAWELHPGATISSTPVAGSWRAVPLVTNVWGGPGVIWGPGSGPFTNVVFQASAWFQINSNTVGGVAAPGGGDYLGVRFLLSSNWHYGWIRFGPIPDPPPSLIPSGCPNVSVLEYAYETQPDTPIVVAPPPKLLYPRPNGGLQVQLTTLMQYSSYASDASQKKQQVPRAEATNSATVLASAVKKGSIGSAELLSLVENSFNTNFPTGARLVLAGIGYFSFLVVNSDQSQILLDAGSVFSITPNMSLNSGHASLLQTNNGVAVGADVEDFTEVATLSYDDSALATRDGTHTSFQISGLMELARSTDLATGRFRESVAFRGVGAGIIRGQGNIILKGTISGTVAGEM